jgi:hypothetical protein
MKSKQPIPKKRTSFQNDSIIFKNDQKIYKKKPSIATEDKLIEALRKYGPTKLTGKPTIKISDMLITDDIKGTRKKGGAVKAKKKK